MKESTSREKILKKIRNALINKGTDSLENVDFDAPVYHMPDEAPEMIFAQKFTALTGKFAFCESEEEFLDVFHNLIVEKNQEKPICFEPEIFNLLKKRNIPYSDQASDILLSKITLTLCECLIARTGSIVVSSKQFSGRKQVVFPDTHIVVAYTSQLVNDIKDGLKLVRQKYGDKAPSLISFITGPSRTADIEKTLILGAHGPKEVYLFLIDNTPGTAPS